MRGWKRSPEEARGKLSFTGATFGEVLTLWEQWSVPLSYRLDLHADRLLLSPSGQGHVSWVSPFKGMVITGFLAPIGPCRGMILGDTTLRGVVLGSTIGTPVAIAPGDEIRFEVANPSPTDPLECQIRLTVEVDLSKEAALLEFLDLKGGRVAPGALDLASGVTLRLRKQERGWALWLLDEWMSLPLETETVLRVTGILPDVDVGEEVILVAGSYRKSW